MNRRQLDYQDPLDFFKQLNLSDQTAVFLYSSTKQSYSGKYSVIGLLPSQIIQTDSYEEFSKLKINDVFKSDYFSDGYFGYLSYDIKNQFEKLPHESESQINPPLIQFVSFKVTYVFYHNEHQLIVYYDSEESLNCVAGLMKPVNSAPVHVAKLNSNFTKNSYLKSIEQIKRYILAGDIFEANLTRKYFGEFDREVGTAELFTNLVAKSPSQYSAFMKFADLSIISSSPERFLKIKNRIVNSKPIKGTRARHTDAKIDKQIQSDLSQNEKDRAENLMIVDLVRNDLGRTAEIGSVTVPELFKIETYETVHQLVSTIEAKIDKKYTVFDTIKAAFPPGSMTGAPKIRAMEIISETERIKRGIYSGAVGYIGCDSYVDLSVVIRTLIINKTQFEFQVGGAIVADSEPESEYQEILDKAKAIAAVLGIDLINFQ